MTIALGYTRAGHEVSRPTRRSPSLEAFNNWTRGDHLDAERILKEHGEREPDPRISAWCRRWAKAHRGLRKAASRSVAQRVSVRGAAEIKARGSR